jgi:RNase adaptor protein for sRNA GlmZ degradation
LDYYLGKIEETETGSILNFRQHYYHFALIRVLQTLGAYGFRGLFERKQHFIQSIPKAIENVKWLLENDKIPSNLTELRKCLEYLTTNKKIKEKFKPLLTLEINSFSFKRGIPMDLSGNGGGFVFDCRGLPNPGRYEEYKKLTGLDVQVATYLQGFAEVSEFIENACQMIQGSIKVYTARNFSKLMVSFGCTGGRHRSVYCADKLAQKLQNQLGIKILVRHREQEKN